MLMRPLLFITAFVVLPRGWADAAAVAMPGRWLAQAPEPVLLEVVEQATVGDPRF